MTEPYLKVKEDVLFWAFRYAIGRSTYSSMDCAEALVDNWDLISDRMKAEIIKEIKSAMEVSNKSYHGGMMEADRREWNRVLDKETP
jgi:hypothetical protein